MVYAIVTRRHRPIPKGCRRRCNRFSGGLIRTHFFLGKILPQPPLWPTGTVAVAGSIILSQVAKGDDLPIVRVVWSRSFLCQQGSLSLLWHSPGAEVTVSVDLGFVLWRGRSNLVIFSRISWNSGTWRSLSDGRVELSSRTVGWFLGTIRGERG